MIWLTVIRKRKGWMSTACRITRYRVLIMLHKGCYAWNIPIKSGIRFGQLWWILRSTASSKSFKNGLKDNLFFGLILFSICNCHYSSNCLILWTNCRCCCLKFISLKFIVVVFERTDTKDESMYQSLLNLSLIETITLPFILISRAFCWETLKLMLKIS